LIKDLKPQIEILIKNKKAQKLNDDTKTKKTHKLIHRFYGITNLFLP